MGVFSRNRFNTTRPPQQRRAKSERNLLVGSDIAEEVCPMKPSSMLSFASPITAKMRHVQGGKKKGRSKSFTKNSNTTEWPILGSDNVNDSPTSTTLAASSESSHRFGFPSDNNAGNASGNGSSTEFPDSSVRSFASATPFDGGLCASNNCSTHQVPSMIKQSIRGGVGAPPIHPQPACNNLQDENEKLQKEVKRLKRLLRKNKKAEREQAEAAAAQAATNSFDTSGISNSNTLEYYESFISEMEKTIRTLRNTNKQQKQRITYLEGTCMEHGIEFVDDDDKLGNVVKVIEQSLVDRVEDVDASSNTSPKPVHNCFRSSAHSRGSKSSRSLGGGGASTFSGGDEGSFTCYDDIWEEDLVQEDHQDEKEGTPSTKMASRTSSGRLGDFLDDSTVTTGLSSRMTTGEASFADDGSIDLSLGDIVTARPNSGRRDNGSRKNKRSSITINQLSSNSTSLTNPGYSVSSSNSWFNMMTYDEFMKSSVNHNSTSMAGDLAFLPNASLSSFAGMPPHASNTQNTKMHKKQGSKEDQLSTVIEDKSSHNPAPSSSSNLPCSDGKEKGRLSIRRLHLPVNSDDKKKVKTTNGSLLSTITRSLSNRKIQVES